jgi:hypothetical protein
MLRAACCSRGPTSKVLPTTSTTRYKVQVSRGAHLYYVLRTSSEWIKGETKISVVHPCSKPGRSENCRFPIGEDDQPQTRSTTPFWPPAVESGVAIIRYWHWVGTTASASTYMFSISGSAREAGTLTDSLLLLSSTHTHLLTLLGCTNPNTTYSHY